MLAAGRLEISSTVHTFLSLSKSGMPHSNHHVVVFFLNWLTSVSSILPLIVQIPNSCFYHRCCCSSKSFDALSISLQERWPRLDAILNVPSYIRLVEKTKNFHIIFFSSPLSCQAQTHAALAFCIGFKSTVVFTPKSFHSLFRVLLNNCYSQ